MAYVVNIVVMITDVHTVGRFHTSIHTYSRIKFNGMFIIAAIPVSVIASCSARRTLCDNATGKLSIR